MLFKKKNNLGGVCFYQHNLFFIYKIIYACVALSIYFLNSIQNKKK